MKFLFASLFCFWMIHPSFAATIIPVENSQLHSLSSDAVSEFRQLSSNEKKQRIREAKAAMGKHQRKEMSDDRTLLLVVLSILLPPLAVYLHQGEINTKFWISLLLSLFFWLPGIIYALLVVLNAI